jgi:MGT family glycosyltransferase
MLVQPPARRGRTVAFIASAYLGHFYPTVEIARALTARGLNVVYLLVEHNDEIDAAIRQEGFGCEDISPGLEFAALAELIRRGRARAARALLDTQIARFRHVIDAHDLGLVMVDNFIRFVGALATFNDIPAATACFNYVEAVTPARRVVTSDLDVDGRSGTRGARQSIPRWLRTPGLLIDRCLGAQRAIVRKARAKGHDTERFIYNDIRLFKYPLFYFAPEELLAAGELHGTFLGLCVRGRHRATDRRASTRGHRPLVFVSLGTVGGQLDTRRAFLRQAIAAFADRPDVQVLVHTGRHIAPAELGTVPPHIDVHQSVPQLDVVERASLVITHAGLGAVKECLFFGTPMLMFPLVTEELENARRVEARGCGVLGGLASADRLPIRSLAKRVLEDRSYAQRTRDLGAAIERRDRCAEGVELLTSMIARPREIGRTNHHARTADASPAPGAIAPAPRPRQVRLPFAIDIPIRSYLDHAFPLSIVSADPDHRAALYGSFIQLFFPEEKLEYDRVLMLPSLRTPDWARLGFLDTTTMDLRSEQFGDRLRFVAWLVECLQDGVYVEAHIDEYYLTGRPSHGHTHSVHDNMIIGADLDAATFVVAGYGRDYEVAEMPFDDVWRAFAEARPGERHRRMIRRIRRSAPRRAALDRAAIAAQLDDYLSARASVSPDEMRRDRPYWRARRFSGAWGLDVYDAFVDYVAQAARQSRPLDLRATRTLWEHKTCMIGRLTYLAEHQPDAGFEALARDYAPIERLARAVRFAAYEYNAGGDADRHARGLIGSLRALGQHEPPVLRAVHARLERAMKPSEAARSASR